MISMIITCASYSNADEIVVPDIVIPKGSTATLDIQLNNNQQIRTEVQFLITLPEGITLVHNSSKLGERFNGMAVAPGDVSEGNNQWTVMISAAGATDAPIPSNSGTLVTVDLLADESIEEGTEINGSLEVTDMNLVSGGSIVGNIQSLVNFKITIGQPDDGRVNLNEASTIVPETATGVDVRVCRTIKANEWSTICLPFAMTEAQMKAAFGDDVQLADFTGVESEFDADDVVGIKVNFSSTTSIEANHPYIIKVSTPVTEFTVDDVDIVTDEDEAYIEFDNGKTGSRRVVYSGFYGTYHAGTVLDKFTLFLSDNKFWYSAGSTKMKAFRAYFDFLDVLTSVENAASRVSMSFGDETTGVRNVNFNANDNHYYNLNGQRLENSNLRKGLYIRNGRKEVIK